MKFNYIRMNNMSQIDAILQEIAKLNLAKLNYSIQELQSMNILDKRKVIENKRILEETNEFLNSATNISGIEEKYGKLNATSRYTYEKSIIPKNVSESINVDLSTLKETVFTLADISFKANKYTKWLCEGAIDDIANNNESFKKLLWKLKGIYNRANREDDEKINVKEELKILGQNLSDNEDKEWKENLKISINDEKSTQKFVQVLYSELTPIWDTESILYEIKNQLNKQLVRCLVNDNYKTFTNWGFSKDEYGKWVLNFDPKEAYERYAFHVPDLRKILNKNLIRTIITYRKFEYMREFTRSIRKNNLDRIKEKNNMKITLMHSRDRFVGLLRRENIDLDQYTMAKFMSKKDFEYIKKEYPELEEKCEMLEELFEPQENLKANERTVAQVKGNTGYEELIRTKIEQNLIKNRKIFVQYGENLDKSASIYALEKHMKDKFGIDDIEVIEINAGEREMPYEKQGVVIDAGKLLGNNFFSNEIGEINANVKKAQKSACGVLNQYGIYVPSKIIQYADTVIYDERSLDARYGVNLSRKLKGEELFEFAEAKREDGKYLMESYLTDEELEKYHLTEEYKKRDSQIKRAMPDIIENIYTFNYHGIEKRICMVDHYINCGAMISYSLGCDYYASISDKQADFIDSSKNLYEEDRAIPKATFSITANPQKGNKKLPIAIIKYCRKLKNKGENDVLKMITISSQNEESIKEQQPFIKPTKDMVVFGGPKAPNLFVTLKHPEQEDNISETIMYEISDILGIKTIKLDKKKEMIEDNTKNWKNIRAKTLIEKLLKQIEYSKVGLRDVQKEGKELLELSKERGEKIDIRAN